MLAVNDGLDDNDCDIEEDRLTDCVTEGETVTDCVFDTVGDPAGVKLDDVEGVGDTELKFINMLNVYLHTGLSVTNVIVVVAPYW